jgi:hypothetical protein
MSPQEMGYRKTPHHSRLFEEGAYPLASVYIDERAAEKFGIE